MANENHVALLKQGVEVWNSWWQEHGKAFHELIGATRTDADLSEANLRGANLRGAFLSGANLRGAILSHANLQEAALAETNLQEANLEGAWLTGADLRRANLRRARLELTHLRAADLYAADLSGANLYDANLEGANLQEANLEGAFLTDADLSEANLRGANLRGAHFPRSLFRADLHRADLEDADLSGGNLHGANLSEANLYMANLLSTNLSGADLSGANLREAELILTNLSGANLSGANLEEAILSASILHGANLQGANLYLADLRAPEMWQTVLNDLDLRQVNGLETVRHKGPSDIGIQTIHRSQGQIPESFLRDAGVPESFIAYARSLSGGAVQYAACYILCPNLDQPFAEQLSADLRANGVRCWSAPHDLSYSDSLRSRLDNYQRLDEKLLLILSKHSFESDFESDKNENLVMWALAPEGQRPKRPVLVPIRLDDAVLTTSRAWAASLRSERLITDFSRWQELDAYQQALASLLHDLQVERTAGE